MDKKEFKDILRELRLSRGWSQSDFAKRINSTKSTVSNWEQGTRVPKLEKLMEVAKVFNVDANTLIGKTSEDVQSNLFIDTHGWADASEVPDKYKRLFNALYELGVTVKFDHLETEKVVIVISDSGSYQIPESDMDILKIYFDQYADMLLQNLNYICEKNDPNYDAKTKTRSVRGTKGRKVKP